MRSKLAIEIIGKRGPRVVSRGYRQFVIRQLRLVPEHDERRTCHREHSQPRHSRVWASNAMRVFATVSIHDHESSCHNGETLPRRSQTYYFNIYIIIIIQYRVHVIPAITSFRSLATTLNSSTTLPTPQLNFLRSSSPTSTFHHNPFSYPKSPSAPSQQHIFV